MGNPCEVKWLWVSDGIVTDVYLRRMIWQTGPTKEYFVRYDGTRNIWDIKIAGEERHNSYIKLRGSPVFTTKEEAQNYVDTVLIKGQNCSIIGGEDVEERSDQ